MSNTLFAPLSRPAADARALIETLESRIAPATLMVTNLGNAGSGSLRDAIAQANSLAGADTIVFQQGLHGQILLGAALPAITDSLTINGGNKTKITVDGRDLYRPLTISGTDLDVTVSHLRITHGNGGGAGGAIAINDAGGHVTITKSILISNNAGESGGVSKGGAIDNENAELTLDKTRILKNTAAGANASGGGIYNGAGATLVLQSSSVSGNLAKGRNGVDGINGAKGYTGEAGDPGYDGYDGGDGYDGTAGTNGGSGAGGGIFNLGTLTIKTSTVSGNTASGGNGGNGGNGGKGGNGGAGGPAYVYDGYHYPAGLDGPGGSGGEGENGGNGGNGVGGGINNGAGGVLTVQNSTISGNTASKGALGKAGLGGKAGNGANVDSYGYTVGGYDGEDGEAGIAGLAKGGGVASFQSVLAFTQVTIAKNNAEGNGGGASIEENTSTNIHNSTIFGNKGAVGGGLFITLDAASDPVTVISSIIAMNQAATNADLFGPIVGDHNLIGLDPHLSKLARRGGPTETMIPLKSSSAIDQGFNVDLLSFDQRGKLRVTGGAADIGAVEKPGSSTARRAG